MKPFSVRELIARIHMEVHILRLRQKIESDPANPALIRSVRGFGYIFEAAVDQDAKSAQPVAQQS